MDRVNRQLNLKVFKITLMDVSSIVCGMFLLAQVNKWMASHEAFVVIITIAFILLARDIRNF